MASPTKSRGGWLIPAGLVALAAIPVAGGAFRLAELAAGSEITPENARFFAAPVPVVLHVFSASVFSVVGAFQFSPEFRRHWPRWHRGTGRLLILCGLVAGLSGLWMTQFYPASIASGSELLYGLRLLFGSAMVMCVVMGAVAIGRRDIVQHRAWMTRGYAIGVGAGTQALVQALWVLGVGKPGGLGTALLMGVGWVTNLAVADWSIRRRSTSPTALRQLPAKL
jgi:uncharacterized membrane protein